MCDIRRGGQGIFPGGHRSEIGTVSETLWLRPDRQGRKRERATNRIAVEQLVDGIGRIDEAAAADVQERKRIGVVVEHVGQQTWIEDLSQLEAGVLEQLEKAAHRKGLFGLLVEQRVAAVDLVAHLLEERVAMGRLEVDENSARTQGRGEIGNDLRRIARRMMQPADKDDQVEGLLGRTVFGRIRLHDINARPLPPNGLNDRIAIVETLVVDVPCEMVRNDVQTVAEAAHRLQHIDLPALEVIQIGKDVAPHATLEVQMVLPPPRIVIAIGDRIEVISLALQKLIATIGHMTACCSRKGNRRGERPRYATYRAGVLPTETSCPTPDRAIKRPAATRMGRRASIREGCNLVARFSHRAEIR